MLSFVAAPDFEVADRRRREQRLRRDGQVSDGTLTDTQAIAVTVTAVNDNNPVITSNGGGPTAAISVAENTTAVTTVTATDADLPAQTLTYSIAGGADAARFTINSSTGVLSFLAAPDFEAPTDAGANNVYDVTVQVSDGTLTDTQAIAVTVTAVNDAPVATDDSYTVSGDRTLDVAAGRAGQRQRRRRRSAHGRCWSAARHTARDAEPGRLVCLRPHAGFIGT